MPRSFAEIQDKGAANGSPLLVAGDDLNYFSGTEAGLGAVDARCDPRRVVGHELVAVDSL